MMSWKLIVSDSDVLLYLILEGWEYIQKMESAPFFTFGPLSLREDYLLLLSMN